MEQSFLQSAHSSPSPTPAQIVTQTPVQVPPTKINVTSEVDRRLRWHVAAWIVMFVLLLASWFMIGYLILSQTNNVRQDAQQDAYNLNRRINDSNSSVQSRLDNRAASLDSRVDQIMRDNAMLRSELSALEMRVAQQESTCRMGCSVDK